MSGLYDGDRVHRILKCVSRITTSHFPPLPRVSLEVLLAEFRRLNDMQVAMHNDFRAAIDRSDVAAALGATLPSRPDGLRPMHKRGGTPAP